MIRIISPNCVHSHAEVTFLVKRLACGLAKRLSSAHGIIALFVDGSVNAVLLLLAAMTLKKPIAICPAREPHAKIVDWLKQIDVNILFSSCGSLTGATIEQVMVEALQASSSTDQEHGDDAIDANFSTIMRTSGTTGIPKSAVIKGRAHYHSACAVNEYFSYRADDVWALTLPLHHVSGFSIIMRSLQARASVYVAGNGDELKHALMRGSITHLSLVPTQLKRLLDEHVSLACVKKIILGGDAVPAKLRMRALDKKLPLYETYGLTETASMIWVRNATTQTACVLPHARMTHDDNGEILVGGDSLFEGYLSDHNTITCNTSRGWFATGDVGVMNESSQLQLISRKSHRIIAGGENVQAEEIERVLETHPAVEECVVVGLPDDDFGMRPIAYIKWLITPIDLRLLAGFVREHLSPIHVPKYFLDWPSDLESSLKKPRTQLSERSLHLS